MAGKIASDIIQTMASEKCASCKDAEPFTQAEASKRLEGLAGWSLRLGSIQKEFRFKSYLSGLEFAYSLGRIAEEEDHHPDMLVAWRRVGVTLSTHSIKGLSRNDFIMAAKAELAYRTILHSEHENRRIDS
jgi:4a-hydroxytetrahydrobiopterin dehydratase